MTGPATGHPSCTRGDGCRSGPGGLGLRGRGLRRRGLCGRDPGGERGALGREAVRLGHERGPILLHRGERVRLVPLDCEERVPAGDDLVARRALLLGASGDEGLRARRGAARLFGRGARARELGPRVRKGRGDSLVLAPDPVQEVVVVEQVRERLRAEREADDVGVVGLVDGPEMTLEHGESPLVLTPEHDEARGLDGDLALEHGEVRPLGREGRLERVETCLLGGNHGLGGPHPGAEAAQLRRQRALGLRGRYRSVAELIDPRVEARLLRAGIAGSGADPEDGCDASTGR